MAYTNSQILSAVINKWVQPVVTQLAQEKIGSFPFLQAIDNKVRSMGWVSPNWSIVKELSPMIEPITNSIAQPFIQKYLSSIPDEAIPSMAHSIVDKALEKGHFEFMEGKILLEKEDLQELKKLLEYNLPIEKGNDYVVKTTITDSAEA